MAKPLPSDRQRTFMRLFLALCIAIMGAIHVGAQTNVSEGNNTAAPSNSNNIHVPADGIKMPESESFTLWSLVNGGAITGIILDDCENYTVVSSDEKIVSVDNSYSTPRLKTHNLGKATLTFTAKNNKAVKFSVEIIVIKGVRKFIQPQLTDVYVGKEKKVIISSYIPLEDYYFYMMNVDNGSDVDNFVQEGNVLTFTCDKEGLYSLRYSYKYSGNHYNIHFNALRATEEVPTVNMCQIAVPINCISYLSTLAEDGAVELNDDNAYDYTITSSDNDIVSVDNNDPTYGSSFQTNKAGEVVLTFTNFYHPDIKFNIVMTVVDPGTTDIIYGMKSRMNIGESNSCSLAFPFTKDNLVLSMDSDDEENSIIGYEFVKDNILNITALREGTVELFYRAKYSYTAYSQPIHIDITSKKPELDANGGGTLNTQKGIPVAIEMPAEVAEAAHGKTIVWKSSDKSIASVSADGVVTPAGLGHTVITASVENAASRAGETTIMTIDFRVTDLVIDLPAEIVPGQSIKATFRIDAGNDTYTADVNPEWYADNSSVIDVQANGIVTAVAPGTAVVTLHTSIGTKQAVIDVVDGEHIELKLDHSNINANVGESYQLVANLAGVTWSSSDESVATVNAEGVVNIVGPGTAVITATSPDGQVAECIITSVLSGIGSVETDADSTFHPVYDLSGRAVARTPEQKAVLSAGFYIQNGRKIYIRH